jgi:broad specificity phosphatase PhoE
LFLLVRHAHSVLNVEGRVNGDPAIPVPLSPDGRDQAKLLGAQLAHLRIDLCVCSRFPRAQETARLALEGRDVPFEVDERLDDIRIGDLEGDTIEQYRAFKKGLGRKQPFPGGESLDQAAERYAAAFEALVARKEEHVLVACHEIPVRYALNAGAGASDLDGPPFHDVPNAVPFLFERRALAQVARRIEELAA